MSKETPSLYEDLRTWILRLSGVVEAQYKLGGTAFKVEGVEFMHFHGFSWMDILLSKNDEIGVLKTGLVLRHRAQVHDQAGWVSLRIEGSNDLANAKRVITLAYKNAKSIPQKSRT